MIGGLGKFFCGTKFCKKGEKSKFNLAKFNPIKEFISKEFLNDISKFIIKSQKWDFKGLDYMHLLYSLIM